MIKTSISSKRAFKSLESNLNPPSRTRFYETFEKGYEGNRGEKTWISRRFLEETIAEIYLEEQFRGHKSRRLRSVYATVNQLIIARPVVLLLLIVSPRFTPFSSGGSRTKVADLEHDTIPPSLRLLVSPLKLGKSVLPGRWWRWNRVMQNRFRVK